MLKRSKILFLILLCLPLVPLYAQESPEPMKRHITIQMDSTTVESFLERLVSENELYFSYNPDLLPAGIRNFNVNDIPLGDVLKDLLPDSLFKVSLIDRQLIITRVEPGPLKISGRVMDDDEKSPLPYASVTIEGTYIGTMTNREGNFDLIIPAPVKNNNIIISSIGYKQKILSFHDIVNESVIQMQSVSVKLREILVKPVDPKSVLQKFRENIKKNYPEEPQLLVTFYRETARQDDAYVGVWEAAMEILKPPYTDKVLMESTHWM
jgi:hypothetical protein